MADITYWIFGAFALATAALLWRRKRQFDRTNEFGIQRHGSFGQKLRADTLDTVLLLIGYGGLLTAVVLFSLIDETLLAWLLIIVIVLAWFKSTRSTKNR